VTWNPINHVLSWQITEGHIDGHGQYEPERPVGSFFVEPQAATMSFAGKKEGLRIKKATTSMTFWTLFPTT